MNKVLIRALLFPVTLIAFGILVTSPAGAAPIIDTTDYHVKIEVRKDSTFKVTETITSLFSGETNGLRRDIPLTNPTCVSEDLTCGGFDILVPIAIYDENGNTPTTGKTKIYEYSPEESKQRYLRFEWELFSGGKYLSREELKWTVEYEVIGGMAVFNDMLHFYWNVFGVNSGDAIDNATFEFIVPEGVTLSEGEFTLYSSSVPEYQIEGNTAIFNIQNLPSFDNFTISYPFTSREINFPAMLTLDFVDPMFNNKIYYNNLEIQTASGRETFLNFPSGRNDIKVTHTLYTPFELSLNLTPGEARTVYVTLQPTATMQFIILLNQILTVVGIVAVPGGIYFVYNRYRKKGVDEALPKTIIPLFKPPKDTQPYLTGSLVDEVVDPKDIVSIVIDLAYRGFIHIKEKTKGKNYELTLNDKDTSSLNEIEIFLINAMFGSGSKPITIETKSLPTKVSYVKAIKEIKDKIYAEMVAKGYFKVSPQTTRNIYIGISVTTSMFGIFLAIGGSIFITMFIGNLSVFTLGIAMFTTGVAFGIAARFMPAKTALGSKVYNDIRGFRMYLKTAERFRLQKLQPKDFERYLAYAIVFGIEKDWAKNFKDMNLDKIDWYEGSGNLTDAILISTFVRSFSDSTITQIRTINSGQSGSRGGGFSGGGSFGGFSGGGGGGGFSGGW